MSNFQTGDGLQDIAVISAGGLHLLQLNYRLVIDKLLEKIEDISILKEEKESWRIMTE